MALRGGGRRVRRGGVRFAHTVLVDMRERLRTSDRPDRVLEVALEAARGAGLLGRRRVLDSTPLYDAVATMDTVTLIGSALRGLLAVVDAGVAGELRAVLGGGDDYTCVGKPQIDWDDRAAREQLIDSRARDGFAVLGVLEGRELGPVVTQAGALLATVVGQDLEEGTDGGVPHRPACRQGSGDLHCGPPGPARAQDRGTGVRRLQRPRRDRPRQ
ncbi:MAG: hypothetical protein ACRDTE_11110 [Pseudonocardiaceae bacterium]